MKMLSTALPFLQMTWILISLLLKVGAYITNNATRPSSIPSDILKTFAAI